MTLVKRAKTWASTSAADTPSSRGSNEESDDSSPTPSKEALIEEVKHLKSDVDSVKGKTRFVYQRRFLFPLGILLGILLGFSLIQTADIQDMQAQISLLMNQYDISLPELPDLNFSAVENEWKKLRSNIPEVWKLNKDGREFQVGEAMKARGLTAEHPVILVPGVVSTGLESWSTAPQYRTFFREKLWGGFNMVSQVMFNKKMWIEAMMLDPDTGLDPSEVKIRACEGIDAASTFIQGYWIWSKIIENLAVVGYDTNNMYLAPYDWRLSYWNLEERDGYFSRLKSTIEGLKKRDGKKVVIAAHSMGSTVLLYFFKWVESPEHGGGGTDWVENHIDSYVSIAGTHLGVAKAMTAFLSGEMKDTVQMNPAGAYVLERFFSRKERQDLFRSWAGSASMWIKGGDTIWGNATWAPDDSQNSTYSHGQLIAFREEQRLTAERVVDENAAGNLTSTEAGYWILEHTPSSFQKMMETNYSMGIERNEEALAKNDGDHTKWSNPLEIRLPNAPSMKIVCAYGHGKETERSYWYTEGEYSYEQNYPDTSDSVCHDPDEEGCTPPDDRELLPLSKRSWIDYEYTDLESSPIIRNGVKMGEGDGTVSLLSLGAMCVEGWKRPRWNPANISVTTVELPHRPNPSLPRGGANTSDHVDVLGSTMLNEIILKVAVGIGHEIEDSFVSNICEYSRQIQWD